jgi:hypothetical protein
MKLGPVVFLALAALLLASMARSGHELPVYPSYYPHEIEITAVAPDQAVELLRAGKLHVYIGAAAGTAAPAPADRIAAATSLGSLVVARLNPESPLAREEAARCAVMTAIGRDIAGRAGTAPFTVHPYPVTPWHGDYLAHVDRAEEARHNILGGEVPSSIDLKVRADGALARSLVRPEWLSHGPGWDVALEAFDAAGLVAGATSALNGWLGPRWVRSGWFHAYRILGSALPDPRRREEVEAIAGRLQDADYQGALQRVNLERQLVRVLVSRCDAMVMGYTIKQEFFNTDFSAGIENVSFDALEGFLSPMFLRTVKLKDFPWNGSLRVGIAASPDAAWNPIGGFSDPFGRLTWFAVGDPALVPSPYESTWILNRFSDMEVSPRQ